MGFFGTVGAKLRQRKAMVAAVLAFSVIGLGLFFVGIWAGSTGVLTFGTVSASASHGPDDKCCDMPMPMGEDHKGPGMSMPGDMPKMPMDKMGPKPDKDCCDK